MPEFVFFSTLVAGGLVHATGEYDPLARPTKLEAVYHDLEFTDAPRNRKLPLRAWLPATGKPQPILLFSHGLGGSRECAAYLAEHWNARGYVVVCLQHPGSDDSVWRSAKPGERLAAMQRAANGQNLLLRAGDVPAVLAQLERWNAEKDHVFYGKIDFNRVGMSGHSFGAMTTHLLAGQTLLGKSFADARVNAVVVMGPGASRPGAANRAFDRILGCLSAGRRGREGLAPGGQAARRHGGGRSLAEKMIRGQPCFPCPPAFAGPGLP